MWFKRNAPDVFAKARFLIQCKDYIVFRLTDRLGTTDFSDATLTALYDIGAKKWSDEVADAAGLDRRLFPEVVPSRTVVGRVSEEAARATGLCTGIPVVAGAGDGSCATLGAGVATTGAGYNYVGGTSWIATLLDSPLIDPDMHLFSLGSFEFGEFCAIGTVQSAGSSLRWLADQICREEKRIAAEEGVHQFDVMDRLARQSVPGARKLYFLPYMMGERAPIWDPDARGALVGLTLAHERSDIIRAVLEGVVYALRSILDVMSDRGIRVSDLRIIGGGAKSDLWLEIMASVYNRPLQIPKHLSEATSIGAALIAGVGVGAFGDFKEATTRIQVLKEKHPIPEWSKKYVPLYQYYKSLYPALKESYRQLSRLDVAFAD
jgi:xylulokinase